MKNRTTSEMIEALKSMTTEERIAYLKVNRPDVFEVRPRTISFGKAPKSGWTDEDRIR